MSKRLAPLSLWLLLGCLPWAEADEVVEQDGTLYLEEVVREPLPAVPAPPRIPVRHEFVDLATLDPPPLLEIRYATDANFIGTRLYPHPAAWLRRDVAEALQGVIRDLAAQGLGLKVFDAYRPPEVQRKMWEQVGDGRFVSDPDGSRGKHTRGTAVDVTLVDALGNELAMPSRFDELTERAYRTYAGGSDVALRNRRLLETVMEKHGFEPFAYEWWHFDYTGWQNRPPLSISFESLRAGRQFASPAP